MSDQAFWFDDLDKGAPHGMRALVIAADGSAHLEMN
jgi:hypothetical protein